MAKDNFFNFNKKPAKKKAIDPKKWGLSIQKREYQDIVDSHLNHPEDTFRHH